MMKTKNRSSGLWGAIGVVLSLVALGLLLPRPLLARYGPEEPPPEPERRFFEETGFWVSGEFLAYFDTHGGLEIFGYPISAPYNDRGILVQYFQKARLEWHPLNKKPYQVQLGLLGDELGFQSAPDSSRVLSVGRAYFAETGHSVNPQFLKYFRSHGGIDLFGYPITGMLAEDQKVVQYFQRLKLIYDPSTGRVTVDNLGDMYVNAHRGRLPPDVLTPPSARFGGAAPQKLRTMVGVGHAVVGMGESQDVAVVIFDDRSGEPLRDAQVKITFRDELGQPLPDLARIAPTDSRGRAWFSVPLEGIRSGTWVVLDVEATYGPTVDTEKQLFLIW
ncbi:MAG: hypothetical protein ACP5HG_00980 [Anaerolineae bacterium]